MEIFFDARYDRIAHSPLNSLAGRCLPESRGRHVNVHHVTCVTFTMVTCAPSALPPIRDVIIVGGAAQHHHQTDATDAVMLLSGAIFNATYVTVMRGHLVPPLIKMTVIQLSDVLSY